MSTPAPKSGWFRGSQPPEPEIDLNALARKVAAARASVADAEEKHRDAGKLVESAKEELELARKELREAMQTLGVEA